MNKTADMPAYQRAYRAAHREERRAKQRVYRAGLLAAGLCANCRAPAEGWRCRECRGNSAIQEAAMTPAEKARGICERAGYGFRATLEAFLLNGYVFSTPELFAMARPVPYGIESIEPHEWWPRASCDAWFIWCGVGDARHLLKLMPFPLPWLGWNRVGRDWTRNHWVRLNRFESALDAQAVIAIKRRHEHHYSSARNGADPFGA